MEKLKGGLCLANKIGKGIQGRCIEIGMKTSDSHKVGVAVT